MRLREAACDVTRRQSLYIQDGGWRSDSREGSGNISHSFSQLLNTYSQFICILFVSYRLGFIRFGLTADCRRYNEQIRGSDSFKTRQMLCHAIHFSLASRLA